MIWMLIFVLAPVKIDIGFYTAHAALPILIEYNLYFLLGMLAVLLLTKNINDQSDVKIYGKNLHGPFLLITFFVLIVNAMQFVDIYFIFKKASDFVELRKLLRNIENSIYPNLIHYALFILHKASILPIFILVFMDKHIKKNRGILYFLAVIIALYPLFNYIFSGKRAFTFFSLIIYFWYVIFFRLWRKKLLFISATVLLVIIFLISGITFQKREEGRNLTMLQSVNLKHSYGKYVPPTAEFNENIENMNKSGKMIEPNVYLYLLNFCQYYVHGIFEFFHLYEYRQSNESPTGNGRFTFSVFYKVLDFLQVTDQVNNAQTADPRALYFDSFFGSTLKDWGDYAKYCMLILGIIFAGVYRLARRDNLLMPLYAVLASIVFAFPMTSMFYNGTGWHYILLCIIFYFGSKLYLKLWT